MDNNENIETLDVNTNVSLGTPIMPEATTLNSNVESLEGPSPVALDTSIPNPDLIKPAPIKEEKPKKKTSIAKIILLVITFIILVIGGFIVYKLFFVKPNNIYNKVINEKYTSINANDNLSYNFNLGDYNLALYKIDKNLYINANGKLFYLAENDSAINKLISLFINSLDQDSFTRSITFDNKSLSFKNTLVLNSDSQNKILINVLSKINNDEELLELINTYLASEIDSLKETIQLIIESINTSPFTLDTLNINIYTSLIKENVIKIEINNKQLYNNLSQNLDNINVEKAKNITLSSIKKLFNISGTSSKNVDLITEAKLLVEAAQKAYDENVNSLSFASGTLKNICFDASYLKNKSYYTGDITNASVLIKESKDKLYWIEGSEGYYELANINDSNVTLKTGSAPSTITTCGDSLSVKATCFNDTCKTK